MSKFKVNVNYIPGRVTTDAGWKEDQHTSVHAAIQKLRPTGQAPPAAPKEGLIASREDMDRAQDALKRAGFKEVNADQMGQLRTYEYEHPDGRMANIDYNRDTEKGHLDILPAEAAKAAKTPVTPPAAPAASPHPTGSVEHHLRPDPNKYKHPSDVKWMTNRLKEMDAALASPNPAESVGALRENPSYPRFTAYKKSELASLGNTAAAAPADWQEGWKEGWKGDKPVPVPAAPAKPAAPAARATNTPHPAHELLTKAGYSHFSHGERHDGYVTKGAEMPIADLHKTLVGAGYVPKAPFEDFTGRTQHVYIGKDPAPYHSHDVAFDTENGKTVRHMTSNVRRHLD